MKTIQLFMLFIIAASTINAQSNFPNAVDVVNQVDANMVFKTTITKSNMIIHGKRGDRVITSKSYAEGHDKSFSEYLAPEREKGTKMLKLDNLLWIYSPSTDRTIQLSGHMLRQSVMGSDLSYEDMMEDRKLLEIYKPNIVAEEVVNGVKTWKIEMKSKVDDATYDSRTSWIDQEKMLPVKEELFAKSGELLKIINYSDVKKIDGKWYPTKMNYKDALSSGAGTDFVVLEINFNEDIDNYIFNKANLKK